MESRPEEYTLGDGDAKKSDEKPSIDEEALETVYHDTLRKGDKRSPILS